MLRLATRIAGALAIVAAFFFGTLFILDRQDSPAIPASPPPPDSVRASHAKQLKAALEAYRVARGHFPAPFGDNAVTDLKKDLVDGKFLAAIPQDPVWKLGDNQYRYVSSGKSYGLLFHLQLPTGKIPAGGTCLTGVGTEGSRWWNDAPDCPF
jgi:hypothetical protein